MGGLFGSGPKMMSGSTITGDQKKLLKALVDSQLGLGGFGDMDLADQPLYKSGSSYLEELMNPSSEAYSRFSAPAMRQYEQQIVPAIRGQFNAGDMAGSSGLDQALAQSARELSENLSSQREQLRFQGSGQALQAAQMPLQQRMQILQTILGVQPNQPAYHAGSPGILGSMLGAAGGVLGGGLGGGLTSLIGGGGFRSGMMSGIGGMR